LACKRLGKTKEEAGKDSWTEKKRGIGRNACIGGEVRKSREEAREWVCLGNRPICSSSAYWSNTAAVRCQ